MTDTIALTGLKFMAPHGVHDTEKATPQEFLVDIAMNVDTRRAGQTDALADTVDYSGVAAMAADVMSGPPRDLIETLAADIAARVLATYLVDAVEVTVHKPGVDLGIPVTDVAVTIRRSRGDR